MWLYSWRLLQMYTYFDSCQSLFFASFQGGAIYAAHLQSTFQMIVPLDSEMHRMLME